jgi:NAD(P)-dependent dehydrogenase (short-subunit alcohol dehydrogenase family)
MEIRGKTFLVSGGGSGLGKATVQLLAEQDAYVMIADVNQAAGTQIATEFGAHVGFVHTDVTDEASVQNAVHVAISSFGALHGAISCAGIGTAERTLSKRGVHSLASFAKTIQVNLIGTFNVLRLAADAISRNEPGESGERGVIVNTASVAAFDGQIGQLAYSASKGGIVGMTLPAARVLASFGIRVMTIAPGIFDTPLLAGLPEPARLSLGQQVPFPARLGQPREYALLVAHIIQNQMLNGEVIRLDGAIRMAPK